MGCDPTGVLRDEHQLILKVVDAMLRLLDAGSPNGTAAHLGQCVEFFRLYTDALHHGKEEDLLFQELVEEGMSPHTGPIAIMKQEHELGRVLVRQMDDAIDGVGADPERWRSFEHAARSYADLLHRHIGKEDQGLFEMADRALDEPACRKLCDAYDTVCARTFEGRTMEELEALAEELIDAAG